MLRSYCSLVLSHQNSQKNFLGELFKILSLNTVQYAKPLPEAMIHQVSDDHMHVFPGALLLMWINFNFSMDK